MRLCALNTPTGSRKGKRYGTGSVSDLGIDYVTT